GRGLGWPFVAGSLGSGPASTLSPVATSLTVWPIGPGESCDLATGITPVRLTNPTVGFSATTPALPAGRIICPPSVEVSVTIASGERPADTATADPAEDPPGVLLVSDGSSTWPPSEEEPSGMVGSNTPPSSLTAG